MNDQETISQRLQDIRARINGWAHQYGRAPDAVTLLAVSKGHGLAAIDEALAAGQRAFGENYLQEALAKITALARTDIEWHFIGQLQANKTRAIAEHFDWVHSIDRLRVAQRLSAQRPAVLPPLNCCLEVRLGKESGKGGVATGEVRQLAVAVAALPRLRLRGLMAIPPTHHAMAAQRQAFAQLRDCYTALRCDFAQLDTLSMGMSGDLEAAIAEGATIVRVGTAIFGPRPTAA